MESNIIQVLPDLEAVSHYASSIFVNLAQNCIASQGRFTVAVSGGSTPRRLYSLLASEQYRNKVKWSRVHFFWTDERCVPKEDEESNFKTIFDTLLSKIPLPAENTHRIKGEEPPEKAAVDYEEDIRKFFGTSGLPAFDFIILGVGEDGHTASLFPNSEVINETFRLAVPVYPFRKNLSNGVYTEKPKSPRITITLPVLNNAAQILFLVAGQLKASIVGKIFSEKGKNQYPAGLINPVRGTLLWLMDKEASALLSTLQSQYQDRQ